MNITPSELMQYIARLENCQNEVDSAKEDYKSAMASAKSDGFDEKALRKILFIRKKGRAKFDEEELILKAYLAAMGL